MLRLALVSVLLAGAAGCEANGGDEGLIVTRIVAPSGTTCTFSASETEPITTHGYVTTALGPTFYEAVAQIKSRITALDGETDLKTVITNGADIDISFADSSIADGLDDVLLHNKAPFTAPVTPNGGITDASFTLLSEGLITALAAKGGSNFQIEVIADFTVRGTMSGSDVESQKFSFGVTVSDHGIVNDVSGVGGTCPARTGVTIRTGNPCNITQDQVVDCCLDGGSFVCPASI